MKKKCILILPRNLFPVVGGYAIKTINLAKILCEKYDTKIITISEEPLSLDEKLFYENNTIDYYYHFVPRWRFYLNVLLGLFSSKPLQCSYFSFNKIEKKVKEMSSDCDIAVATIIRTAPYLNFVKNDTVRIIDMVDSIGVNYARSIDKTKSIFWKSLYKLEVNRLLDYEASCVNKANLTWYVNKEEASIWSEKGNTLWTPMPIKEFIFNYKNIDKRYSGKIAFFGKMNYQPNIDAFLWYYNQIHLKLAFPPELIIVGSNPVETIINIANKDTRITVTGFLDDPYLILNSVKGVIAPMQTGGGMQNKVLETMALGCVNILSDLAASPIDGALDQYHFLIANTLDDYKSAFLKLDDLDEKARIGENARAFVSKQYRYEIYKNILIQSIDDCVII